MSDIDEVIKLKTEHMNKELAKMEKLKADEKLKFYERIQLSENLEQLKRVEDTQQWAFEETIKKHNPELLLEWKDLFASYFTEYLHGKVKSIFDWKKQMNIKATKNKRDWGLRIVGSVYDDLE